MSSVVGIEDPDGVRRAGQNLSQVGETVEEKALALRARIAESAGGQPWGDHMFGEQFVKEYTQVLEGEHQPFNELINTRLEKAGTKVRSLGDRTTSAMLSYEAQDVLAGHEIAKETDV